MPIRHLINTDGAPFSDEELGELSGQLDALIPEERKKFRDANADAVATLESEAVLIVAGPGTGKSTLFNRRILCWFGQNPAAKVLALSFVRKLVADLKVDIQKSELSEEQKKQVDVFTLHKYARSVVEQNHGTRAWKFAPHFRIIGQSWKDVVWSDALLRSNAPDPAKYSWKAFEKQLYNNEFEETKQWKAIRQAYFVLCRFYNAAGFSDLILRARDALVENPELNKHVFFVIDEYQDFNASEENLLKEITRRSKGKLIAGDDDQVLYETFRSGKASLIRAIYADKGTTNSMLPFCGRCDFHITRAASHFISRSPDPGCIKKIYLPLTEAGASQKVQIVGCPTPGSAVDYIRKFIEDHANEIEQRRKDLAAGGAKKNAYLLILSPTRNVNFYSLNGARDELLEVVRPYAREHKEFSEEYYKVLNYYSLANYPTNNFTFRKVLYFEKVPEGDLGKLLTACIDAGKPFSEIDDKHTKNALAKASRVREILESKDPLDRKLAALAKEIEVSDLSFLKRDLEKAAIDKARVESIEHQEEEDAELEEVEVRPMAAVELLTIMSSKGLSADHVIIIGFDNVNMGRVTRNAFYVAMTRARKSLHILTALKASGGSRPHDFLDHLPNENLEFASYKKGGRTKTSRTRQGLLQYLKQLGTWRGLQKL